MFVLPYLIGVTGYKTSNEEIRQERHKKDLPVWLFLRINPGKEGKKVRLKEKVKKVLDKGIYPCYSLSVIFNVR